MKSGDEEHWIRRTSKKPQPLSSDLKQNLEENKPSRQRADAIVKGMLAHSRQKHQEKKVYRTDLNCLSNEYFETFLSRLRAKDKSFNCRLWLNLDPNSSKEQFIPQDIGRCCWCSYNASTQSEWIPPRVSTLGGFSSKSHPLTKTLATKSPISVSDNGSGHPQISNFKDKNLPTHSLTTKRPGPRKTGLGCKLKLWILLKRHGENWK